ncbi:MAG: protein-disulfide reductase DsbD family protein, partial [Hyphomonadaceae bacterium]|nr:protein-disulfide reductase DsbD family protein [Hyphomonadaceae bacterium]
MTRAWAIAAALLLAVLGANAASAQAVKTLHTNASLIAERSAVAPGDTFLGALKLDLEDPWHVYWMNPGDSGLPPAVSWTLPEGVQAGDFKWPAPHAIPLATLMNYGYEHQLVLPVEFKVPATAKPGDTINLSGKFDWLICSDVCVPDGAELSLTIPVQAARATDTTASGEIGKSIATMPVPLTGAATVERTADGFRVAAVDGDLAEAAKTASDIHFFPEGQEIIHAAKQQVRRGDAGVSVTLKASDYAKAGDQPLPGIVVVKAADGSLRSWQVPAQPGTTPAGVANVPVGGGSNGAPVGFVEIALMMGGAFLGGLILNLMPCVLPVLAVKAAGLVHTAHDPKQTRAHGLAYLGGVMTCFAAVALVIVGLQMAGQQVAVGFQLQHAPIVAFFALVMFALGLNLLGVFEMGTSLMGVGQDMAGKGGVSGAYYTGLLAAFVGAPCVGPFMAVALGWALTQSAPVIIAMFLVIGLGMAAPFVLLSFTPVMARLIPKPGAWMATFRQVLAFPMFATMLWLLWVVAGQTGANGALVVLAGAITLGFGIWLATKIGGKLPGRILAGLVILTAFVAPSIATAGIKAPVAGETLAAEAGAEDWSVDRVSALRAEGRVIFVDFTARWCVTCQVNTAVAIDSAKVREAFARHNVAFLVADWTNQDSVIAAALAEHGRAGVP